MNHPTEYTRWANHAAFTNHSSLPSDGDTLTTPGGLSTRTCTTPSIVTGDSDLLDLAESLHDPAIGALGFDERVGLLVEAEHLSRADGSYHTVLARLARAMIDATRLLGVSRQTVLQRVKRGRS